MNNKLFSVLVVIGVLVTGCATPPVERSLSREMGKDARDATVFVIAPQKGVEADVIESRADGTSYGIVGILVASAIESYENSKAYREMQESVAPIAEAAGEQDFLGDLHTALKKSGLFLKPDRVMKVEEPPASTEELQELVDSAPSGPVVVIRSNYMLDYSHQVLMTRTSVRLWGTDRKEQTVQPTVVTYYSYPVNLSPT